MKTFLFAAAMLLGMSVSANSPKHMDLGPFKPSFYHNPVNVKVVLYQDMELLNAQYQILMEDLAASTDKDNVVVHKRIRAFTFFHKDSNNCVIHVVQPSNDVERQFEYGHELMHCIFGNYHRE